MKPHTSDLSTFVHRMPKVNLHTHLEGTIQPATLLTLAHRNNIALPATDENELRAFFAFRDFDHFIKVYTLITSCLEKQADYELVAYEFGRQCQAHNVRYAEVTFSIETNCELSGLPWRTILNALNKGRIRAERDFQVSWQWVFDIVRDHPETQQDILEIVKQTGKEGVVALGLTGHEVVEPAKIFESTFLEAKRCNIKRTIHAGELNGPSSIWDALRLLHANRIGHGVRAIQDPALMDYLVKEQIPLELCPTSNIRLGIFPDFAHHPLRALWDAGVCITVNDDDPALFNTDMTQEYQVLVDHFGFDTDMLEKISLNAIHVSFLDEKQKKALEKDFRQQFIALRGT
jgi:aminodeoxyfutalosine deaminase